MKKFIALSSNDRARLATTLLLAAVCGALIMAAALLGLQQVGLRPLPSPPLLVLVSSVIGAIAGLLMYLQRELWKPLHQLFRSLPRRATQHAALLMNSGVAPIRLLAHRMNELLSQLQDLIATNHREINDLAHDLRGPLTRLMLRVESLRSEERPNPELIAGLEADVNALLALDQELDGLAQMKPRTLTLDVHSMQQISQEVAASYGSELVMEEVDTRILLRVDRRMLLRTLYNLVDNALEHGGAPVRISCSRSEQAVVISVEDTGSCGLHPSMPAQPLPPAHHGMGLAIARGFCLSHGGTLDLGSSPLGGWRVDLVLGGMANPVLSR